MTTAKVNEVLKEYANIHIAVHPPRGRFTSTNTPKTDHWSLVITDALKKPETLDDPSRHEYQLEHQSSSTPAYQFSHSFQKLQTSWSSSKARVYVRAGRIPKGKVGDMNELFRMCKRPEGDGEGEVGCQGWVVECLERLKKEKWAEVYVDGPLEEMRDWIYS
ncbi:hypothetical protein HK097_002917 [Rhizophlyctis rosea]|uniref:Uncharacterized protein n=1 Tax=Rhizophlyctis rosea TaxID=64517 RepID=A0AAD5X402_9FUNG|nr:hypothetical protein HK097_002917 [Rhizophlyctis rosea]